MTTPPGLLLSTVTGSRLYGNAHADSDYDTFNVYEGKRKMRQRVSGKDDVTNVSYEQFLRGLSKGVPQYLEALYSQQKSVNHLYWLNFQPGYHETWNTYTRTIKAFWLEDTYKQKLHACRLYMNLLQFLRQGRFNPTLTEQQWALCRWHVENIKEYPRL